jgi:hypothetical protein
MNESTMNDSTMNPVDMNSDVVHDEVELLLNCDGKEIMELIASDPKYYLDIVSRYIKTRSGEEICLPYLFNITIVKSSSEFRIKFKFSDNGSWNEVGFSGGQFEEEEVYKAFTKKVNYLIDKPLDYHRSIIDDTLNCDMFAPRVQVVENNESIETIESNETNETKIAETTQNSEQRITQIVSQGDQTKLTKIDRFLKRPCSQPSHSTSNITYKIEKDAPISALNSPLLLASTGDVDVVNSPMVSPGQSCNICWNVISQCKCISDPSNQPDRTTTDNAEEEDEDGEDEYEEDEEDESYEDSYDEDSQTENNNAILLELDALTTLCPSKLALKYKKVISLLKSNDLFYTTIIDTLPRLTAGQRALMSDFLFFN